jgi:hypothetical protein
MIDNRSNTPIKNRPWDNRIMRQLQLFTTADLAKMRDRTASRNYSPERDEFRRDHERHRSWGLARRHADRLRRVRETRPPRRDDRLPDSAAVDRERPRRPRETTAPDSSRPELEPKEE